MKKLQIQERTKFGKLEIITEIEKYRKPSGQTQRQFRCKCDCGNEIITKLFYLTNGETTSCGCVKKIAAKKVGQLNKRHGMTHTSTFSTWRAMRRRCYDSTRDNYHLYGGRGIIVCSEWLNSFEQFYKDMGDRPIGTTIDRINVNGNYEPTNCRWATPAEQAKNRRNYEKLPRYN